MKLKVNNEIQIFDSPLLLDQALKQNNLLEKKGIAVAVNGEIIPRSGWPQFILNENDNLTIIQATQGG